MWYSFVFSLAVVATVTDVALIVVVSTATSAVPYSISSSGVVNVKNVVGPHSPAAFIAVPMM